jgi:hypothetical protein
MVMVKVKVKGRVKNNPAMSRRAATGSMQSR